MTAEDHLEFLVAYVETSELPVCQKITTVEFSVLQPESPGRAFFKVGLLESNLSVDSGSNTYFFIFDIFTFLNIDFYRT